MELFTYQGEELSTYRGREELFTYREREALFAYRGVELTATADQEDL